MTRCVGLELHKTQTQGKAQNNNVEQQQRQKTLVRTTGKKFLQFPTRKLPRLRRAQRQEPG